MITQLFRKSPFPALVLSLFAACFQGSAVNAAVVPVVTFTSPQFGEPFAFGTTVKVSLTATVSTGSILRVVLVNNHGKPDTLRQSPYASSNSDLIPGYYAVEAKVTTADTTVTAQLPFVIKPKPYPPLPASPAANGKLKVFILAGQSNMQGMGMLTSATRPGAMDYYIKNQRADYGHLVDNAGKPLVRNDVWYIDKSYAYSDPGKISRKWLSAGCGSSSDRMGPEYGFGWVMGDYFKDPVLLIKTAWGGRSLAYHFLPPSSKSYSTPVKDGDTGWQYQQVIKLTKSILDNLPAEFPGYDGKGYEIMGFGWVQGWNDAMVLEYVQAYEKNLVNLIIDLRKDLRVADMPFTVGSSGQWGYDLYGLSASQLARVANIGPAQLAVADYTKYPAFTNNVGAVDTRPFMRGVPVSPSSQGYHFNCNFETYYKIGESMAHCMIPLFPFNRNTPARVSALRTSPFELKVGTSESAVRFYLPEPGEYSLSFINLAGKAVKTFHGRGVRGLNRLSGSLQGLPQGVLFMRLSTGKQVAGQRISNLK